MARWEPALRAAFSDQAVFDLDHPAPLEDEAGRDLDLTRSFTLDEPVDEIRDFLHRVGFVHLRDVLDAAEIAALTADVTAALGRARPDDRKSWWTTVDGREVCNRVNYLNDGSARIAALGADPRFLRIAALGGNDLRDAHDRLDGNGVVIKVPGSTGGSRRPALASRLRNGWPSGEMPDAQRRDPARRRHAGERTAADDPGVT